MSVALNGYQIVVRDRGSMGDSLDCDEIVSLPILPEYGNGFVGCGCVHAADAGDDLCVGFLWEV